MPVEEVTTEQPELRRLFVYGIFLDAHMRDSYNMGHNIKYDTIRDLATFGGGIVSAHRIPDAGLALSGLRIELPDSFSEEDWARLDALEAGYTRQIYTTVGGRDVFVYIGRGSK